MVAPFLTLFQGRKWGIARRISFARELIATSVSMVSGEMQPRVTHCAQEPNMDRPLLARQRADKDRDVRWSGVQPPPDSLSTARARVKTRGRPHFSGVIVESKFSFSQDGNNGVHGSTTPSPPPLIVHVVWHGWHSYYVRLILSAHSPPFLKPPPSSTTSMLIGMASHPVEYKPTWWPDVRVAYRSGSCRSHHLSGMGDSDCAERARRIARLSLRMGSDRPFRDHRLWTRSHRRHRIDLNIGWGIRGVVVHFDILVLDAHDVSPMMFPSWVPPSAASFPAA
ncbi:hypothetical protein C8Q74DRAFT_1221597 [Fomes fomentarius]|nr:hypothetical protein C8Q74DRAFT_1221597 [Fomes fomentarius]